MKHGHKAFAILFALVLWAGFAHADGSFVFRYKAAMVGQTAEGNGNGDGVCDPGEEGSPDCPGTTPEEDHADDGVCDPGEEDTRDCKIITVDQKPNWDGFYSNGSVTMSATVGTRNVGADNLIYQCYKATGGNGNYMFWLNQQVGGDTHWIDMIDVVMRSDLGVPMVSSQYSYAYVAPAFDAGLDKLSVDHNGEACVRVKVKPDQVPAFDALGDLWVDDYPSSVVSGDRVAKINFNNTASWAAVSVKLKPNCLNEDCTIPTVGPDLPTPHGFTLEPTGTTQKVSSTKAYHLYDSQAVWNGADMARGPMFVAKGGSFPYTINAAIGQGKWLAQPAGDGDGGCLISALPEGGLMDSSPGSVSRHFTGTISVREASGDERHYAISLDDQNVKSSFFDSGSTMAITIPDCNGEYGPDYAPKPPVDKVAVSPTPADDDVDTGTGPAPLALTMTTTRKETGSMFYQCFHAAGGYGNYNFWIGSNYSGADQGDWQEAMDLVTPANLSSGISNVEEYPVPSNVGSDWIYTTTSNGDLCVRVTPKADGSGNRKPLKLYLGLQDYQNPDPVFGPSGGPDYSGMITRNFQMDPNGTPGGGGGGTGNNGDGVCQPGETGSDCNGVCEMGESGSADCEGGTAPTNNGDGLCQPGESGSDCDGVCQSMEEGSADCPVPADFVPATISGFGSAGSAVTNGAATTDSLFAMDLGTGYLQMSPYARLMNGGKFGYHCFYVSNGSWPNWTHFLYVDAVQGSWNWLTNLDLVYKSDLYFGEVAPYSYTDHTGRYLPSPPTSPATTTQTNVCARWIVQRPAEGDRLSIPLKLETTNVNGFNRDTDPTVKRYRVMDLTPQ